MNEFWRIIDDDADDFVDGDDGDDEDDDFEQAVVDKLTQRKINDDDDCDDDVNDDVEQAVMDELRRIIEDSEIMAEDDELWPQPDRVGDDITNDVK